MGGIATSALAALGLGLALYIVAIYIIHHRVRGQQTGRELDLTEFFVSGGDLDLKTAIATRGAIAALILGFSALIGLGPLKAALGLQDVSAPVFGFAAIGLSIVGFVLGALSEKPRALAPAISSGG
jgi:hypothetical protein